MEKEICGIIEKALGLRSGSVTIEDSMDTVPAWDSLGLLSILSALEERFGHGITALEELSSVRSVKEIVDLLKQKSFI